MPITVGDITIHVGPKETEGPDDLKKAIIDFIMGAKKRLYIAVQELESEAITEAIVEARKNKLLVKLVVEGSYLSVKKATKNPFIAKGENEKNRELYNAVLRANVDAKSDYNTAIFHQKFIVRDSDHVLTGSTNFTATGVTNNLNHVVVIKSRKLANDYRKEFDEIQRGRFGKYGEPPTEKPRVIEVSGVPVKALFAPDHAPEMEIMKQMMKATTQIDFAMFTFAQSSGIDDTMKVLAAKGIQINGILDNRQANQKWAATHGLKGLTNVTLMVAAPSGRMKKLHHKLMVIDGQVIIAGSFNYTGPANRVNDENIVIIGDLGSKNQASIKKQKKLAEYCLDEMKRIRDKFGQTV